MELLPRIKQPEVCEWKKSEGYSMDDCYDSGCGEIQYFTEGNIKENKYKYCPYCGGVIVEGKGE